MELITEHSTFINNIHLYSKIESLIDQIVTSNSSIFNGGLLAAELDPDSEERDKLLTKIYYYEVSTKNNLALLDSLVNLLNKK